MQANPRITIFVGISQISNRVAIEDNDVSKGILAETRNDGRVLSETVSVLTLLFLPGTFVSVSVFLFFEREREKHGNAKREQTKSRITA